MREKKNQYFLLHIVTTICLININFTIFFLMFFFFILLNEKQRIRYTVKKIGSYCLVIPYTVVHHKYSEACLNQTSGTKPNLLGPTFFFGIDRYSVYTQISYMETLFRNDSFWLYKRFPLLSAGK